LDPENFQILKTQDRKIKRNFKLLKALV
jgi:hypothetical protein